MNDYIMALFQLAASFFVALNIFTIIKDGEIKGVSMWMIGFFTMWTFYGIWNWYVLNQFWSFVTSIIMAIVYTGWLTLAALTKKKPRVL